MRRRGFAGMAALLAALVAMPLPAAARGVALLIGIGQYQDKAVSRLEGPPHDVAVLREILVQHWGFAAADVRTLVDHEASRARILDELAALRTRSRRNEPVFVYFSGHGTSVLDAKARLPLPHTSGALLPWDFPGSSRDRNTLLAGLIVGRTDLQPILRDLDASGRIVTVVFDSCYSGNAVRSAGPPAAARHFPLRLAVADEFESGAAGKAREAPPPYPYGNVFFLSAASDSETAGDLGVREQVRWPTFDGRPHGMFTDALLRALSGRLAVQADSVGRLSNGEVHAAVRSFMEQRGYPHVPQRLPELVEDRQHLTQRPLLDSERAPPPQADAAAELAVRVRLTGSLPPRLEEELRAIPGVQLVAHNPAFEVRDSSGKLALFGPAGDMIGSYALAAGHALAGRLRQQVWYELLAHGQHVRPAFDLQIETTPATRGGTFLAGETLAFSLQSAQPAWVMLLNLDAEGKVSVLYPAAPREVMQHPARRTLAIPGTQPQDLIRVTPPFGSDYLLAFAFAARPPWLEKIAGRQWLPGDPGLAQLADALADRQLRFGRAAMILRTLPRPASFGG